MKQAWKCTWMDSDLKSAGAQPLPGCQAALSQISSRSRPMTYWEVLLIAVALRLLDLLCWRLEGRGLRRCDRGGWQGPTRSWSCSYHVCGTRTPGSVSPPEVEWYYVQWHLSQCYRLTRCTGGHVDPQHWPPLVPTHCCLNSLEKQENLQRQKSNHLHFKFATFFKTRVHRTGLDT